MYCDVSYNAPLLSKVYNDDFTKASLSMISDKVSEVLIELQNIAKSNGCHIERLFIHIEENAYEKN